MTTNRCRRWLSAVVSAVFASWIGLQGALAEEAGELRVTDYFLTHTSNEPFYAQYDLDPIVTLRVREVVLGGRERTAAQDDKVLLLIHGLDIPAEASFDVDYENLRSSIRRGWRAWSSMEGSKSTR